MPPLATSITIINMPNRFRPEPRTHIGIGTILSPTPITIIRTHITGIRIE